MVVSFHLRKKMHLDQYLDLLSVSYFVVDTGSNIAVRF